MDLVQIMSLVEHQIEQRVVLDLSIVQGEDFFEEVGAWMMHALTHLHQDCRELGIIPNIQLETMTMQRHAYVTLLTEAFLDDLGIVYN